jgi:hypothetical protein
VGVLIAAVGCGSVNGFLCNISYGVVVTRRSPYDLAVTSSGGTYVLRVGEQVVFGLDGGPVQSTSPAVLEPEGPFASPGPGLNVFRAVRPGQASLSFRDTRACVDTRDCTGAGRLWETKFIVSSSATRFDHTASVADAGATIHLRKGQTLEVSLAPEPGFDPWQWSPWLVPTLSGVPDQQLLDVGTSRQGSLIDPMTRYFRTQDGWIMPDRAGYLIQRAGIGQMGFKASPADCRPAEDCPKLDRIFVLTLEVDS